MCEYRVVTEPETVQVEDRILRIVGRPWGSVIGWEETKRVLREAAAEIRRLRTEVKGCWAEIGKQRADYVAMMRERDQLKATVTGLKADAAAWAGRCGDLQDQLDKQTRPAGLDYWLAARRVRVRYPNGREEVVEIVEADDVG